MDQERRAHILKAYEMGMGRYIWVHGVLSWGVSTAFIFRAIVIISTYGWSLRELAKGIFSPDTLVAIVFFGLVGVLFGFLMFKWIERTAKKLPPEPPKPKEKREKKPEKKKKRK